MRGRPAHPPPVAYVSIGPSAKGFARKCTKAGVRLNRRAVPELFRMPAVLDQLEAKANKVAVAVKGGGVAVDLTVKGKRPRASVRTVTYRASRGEAKDRRLSRALRAARG